SGRESHLLNRQQLLIMKNVAMDHSRILSTTPARHSIAHRVALCRRSSGFGSERASRCRLPTATKRGSACDAVEATRLLKPLAEALWQVPRARQGGCSRKLHELEKRIQS